MEKFKRSGRVEVVADATPDAIWDVVSDVTRVGDWSHECRGAGWSDGATGAVPGARFRGRNKHGRAGWTRVNEIVTADAPRELAWRTVPSLLYPDSTQWTITLEPVDGGTRIVQSFEVLKLNEVMGRIYLLLIPQHRDRSAALEQDLRNLGEVARTGVPAVP